MLLQRQERRRNSTPPIWVATSLGGILFLLLSWNVVGRFHRTSRAAPRVVPVPKGPVVPVDQLIGTGRIYLVQIGAHDLSYSLNEFAGWLLSKYALDVQVLPPMRLDRSA
jgi:hypothetical protein